MPDKGLRINKAIAGAGVCSRRQADELVRRGVVRIDGEVVRELGSLVHADNCLEVDGKKIDLSALFAGEGSAAHRYLMLHKPVQVVCTVHDPEGRTTVLDLLPKNFTEKRLFPVGRLDYFSEGLILLTNDGELTQRLTHPRYHLPKYYDVLLREHVSDNDLQVMRQGMTLSEGDKLAPVDVERLPVSSWGGSGQSGNSIAGGTLLRLTLHQGINRQIRRMCRDLGLTILRLRRVGQGPLLLGGLELGKCRELTAEELSKLKSAVGLK